MPTPSSPVFVTASGGRERGHLSARWPLERAARFVLKHKGPCTVAWTQGGEPIGGVSDMSGRCDDRRLRWVWWFDSELIIAAGVTMGRTP